MFRCANCQEAIENIFPEMRFNDWLKLMNYFEHELAEGEITNATYEIMTGALLSLRPKEGECSRE